MSVTFTASPVGPRSHAVSCGCEEATAQAVRYESFEAAHAAAEAANRGTRAALPGCALPQVCPDYPLYARPVYGEAAPEINLHQASAALVLDVLGLTTGAAPASPQPSPAGGADFQGAGTLRSAPGDASGQMDAEEFLGRVLVAVALTPDDCGTDGYWSGRFFRGARAAGYLHQRLAELRQLAQWCHERGRQVTWG